MVNGDVNIMKTIVFDIESDGLLDEITKIHCIACKDIVSKEEVQFTPDSLDGFAKYIDSVQCVIGHNVVSFDIPAIKKILGIDLSSKKIVDTLLLSKLLNPDRPAHSLEYWGQQLGNYKGDFHDWSAFTQEMLEYCIQDVRVNEQIYNALKREAGKWDWSKAYALELKVAQIIQIQEEHGVKFDSDLATKYHAQLNDLMTEIENKVEPLLPPRRIPESKLRYPPKKMFKKDGTPSALAHKYFGDRLYTEGHDAWYVRYDDKTVHVCEATKPLATHEPMTLANQDSLKEWLLSEGWLPTIYNYRKNKVTGRKEQTSPKFQDASKNLCPNLEKLGEKVEFIRDVTTWLSYRNRRNVILSNNGTGWLANRRLDNDQRLSASADTVGTNTGRFAHRVVANVPRVSSLFGREMRSLFTVDKDCYMVGWDASALESRIEGHYTYKYDGGEYASELLDGDIHSKNAEAFGCDRDTAKTVKYAVTYGAQAPKLGVTLGVPKAEGQRIYDEFWKSCSSLKTLRDNLTRYWNDHDRKYIKGLDGRKVMTRSEHSLINTLFQSGGIICMKQAMVLWDEWVKKEGLNASQVIHYHDEAQAEVHKSQVQFKKFGSEDEAKAFTDPDRIWSGIIHSGDNYYRAYSRPGELGVLSIREAGNHLGLNVELDAEYMVGKTWAETH